ncbi:transcriptional regulator [Agromyces rhizosphaerae]|uniref:Transcriptional regulator n=1 Tax=Agromyces rhizosphaerae TaxID=88374 RepID=A0A9W6CTR9_9MICO|nr:MerR family transcriptional regulator [Agromyces rhizosphaerae]GLI26202.1 transcriptional regulator [Agromyces rhizosphaerae]
MRISELAAATGVAVATLKYYLREGLLHAGEARGATQADYDATHVRRVRLIRALTGSVGLSLQQARAILDLVDEPGDDLYETLGSAVSALPPPTAEPDPSEPDPLPHARAAMERLGWRVHPTYAGMAQLDRALAAASDAGLPMTDERLDAYGRAMHDIAGFDLERLPGDDPAASVEYTVLGTALYEPVVLALRRLAHHEIAGRMLHPDAD